MHECMLGRTVYAVDLKKPTIDEAILESVVEQETIDKDGYIVVWLKDDAEASTRLRGRVFDFRDKAVAFYEKHRPLFVERDRLSDEFDAKITELLAPIKYDPEFPHLAEKK